MEAHLYIVLMKNSVDTDQLASSETSDSLSQVHNMFIKLNMV